MVELTVTFPALDEYIRMTRQMFQSVILGPNELVNRKILFSINEGIINAVAEMKKEYGKHSKKTITVELFINQEEVTVHIIDQGVGLSEDQIKQIGEKSFFDIGLGESGRGYLFIKGFMDELWFDITVQGKFLVGMSKKLYN